MVVYYYPHLANMNPLYYVPTAPVATATVVAQPVVPVVQQPVVTVVQPPPVSIVPVLQPAPVYPVVNQPVMGHYQMFRHNIPPRYKK